MWDDMAIMTTALLSLCKGHCNGRRLGRANKLDLKTTKFLVVTIILGKARKHKSLNGINIFPQWSWVFYIYVPGWPSGPAQYMIQGREDAQGQTLILQRKSSWEWCSKKQRIKKA